MAHRVVSYGDQTSLGWRKTRAGQRMLIGFQGTSVNDDLRRVVKEIQPAGFVLFRRNVEEPAQVFELNRELRSLCRAENPAFIAVDQEGGRVQRIKSPATEWPPMRHVGAAKDITAEVSAAIATELRAMGFNLNFAPVADVDSNPKKPHHWRPCIRHQRIRGIRTPYSVHSGSSRARNDRVCETFPGSWGHECGFPFGLALGG